MGKANKQEKRPPKEEKAQEGLMDATPQIVDDIAPSGVLHAAINTGNPVLVQQGDDGTLSGVTVDLARELGQRLEVPVELVPFNGAGKVFDAAGSGVWDVAFLAIDPERSKGIRFTEPYVIIEGTCIVRASSHDKTIGELDRKGARMSVVKGAAYDLYLSRTLKHATLLRKATFEEQMELFVSENLEASAGVRQPLEEYAANHKGFRVFEGHFTQIRQAMGLPQGRKLAGTYLDSFLDEMKRSGFIEDAFIRAGQTGITLVPVRGKTED